MAEESGYTIGIRELYEEIRGLGDKLTAYMAHQDVRLNSIEHRLAENERSLEEVKEASKEEKRDRRTTNRQFVLALVSSFVLPLVVSVIVYFLTK